MSVALPLGDLINLKKLKYTYHQNLITELFSLVTYLLIGDVILHVDNGSRERRTKY